MDLDYSVHYQKWHPDTDAHYSEAAAFYGRLLGAVLKDLAPAGRVLDVGCGIGLLVSALQQAGFKASGIDLSSHQIQIAKRRGLACEAVSEDYLVGLADREPMTFDAVFLMDVLEHVPETEQLVMLKAIHKLLKPAGHLVICVPNANSTFATRWRYIDWTHTTSFTEHSLEFIVTCADFKQLSFLPFEFGRPATFPYLHQLRFWHVILRKTVRLWRRLEALAELGREGARVPLGLNLLAVAKKSE